MFLQLPSIKIFQNLWEIIPYFQHKSNGILFNQRDLEKFVIWSKKLLFLSVSISENLTFFWTIPYFSTKKTNSFQKFVIPLHRFGEIQYFLNSYVFHIWKRSKIIVLLLVFPSKLSTKDKNLPGNTKILLLFNTIRFISVYIFSRTSILFAYIFCLPSCAAHIYPGFGLFKYFLANLSSN